MRAARGLFLRLSGRALRCDSGAAAVEFAIVSLLFVCVLLATFELCRAFYVLSSLDYAVDYGARKIMLNPDEGAATVETTIRDRFYAGDKSLVTVASPISGSARTITAHYPMSFAVPFTTSSVSLSVSRKVMR